MLLEFSLSVPRAETGCSMEVTESWIRVIYKLNNLKGNMLMGVAK
jgi:hypothetical protein